MNDSMDLVDVSNEKETKKKDRFMLGVYISLILLVALGLIVYFFGYDLLKPIIKV